MQSSSQKFPNDAVAGPFGCVLAVMLLAETILIDEERLSQFKVGVWNAVLAWCQRSFHMMETTPQEWRMHSTRLLHELEGIFENLVWAKNMTGREVNTSQYGKAESEGEDGGVQKLLEALRATAIE
ncbi:MAG: hypothetical protein M1822_009611 [Bathelium mastoideum]|nr:MAG: hypothetical protein M1822_009611 [Bathelium mastoideum]